MCGLIIALNTTERSKLREVFGRFSRLHATSIYGGFNGFGAMLILTD